MDHDRLRKIANIDNITKDDKGAKTSNENAGLILGLILRTRIQRKANHIIRSGFFFLLTAIFVILHSATVSIVEESVDGEEPSNIEIDVSAIHMLTESTLGNIVGLCAAFVAILCIFLYFHASRQPTCTYTKEEVEVAYEETNRYTPFDSILELSFPWRFRGKNWALPYIIIGTGFLLFLSGLLTYLDMRESLRGATKASLFAETILMYQICSDFVEYWVHTRTNKEHNGTDRRSEGFADEIGTQFLKDETNRKCQKILKSRAKRTAKDTMRAGFNFLLVSAGILLQTATVTADPRNANFTTFNDLAEAIISSSMGNVIGLSIICDVLLCSFVFWHTTQIGSVLVPSTNKEIESAYARTNSIPAIGGILELGFPFKFRGPMWSLPYYVLGVCFAVVFLGLLIYLDEEEKMTHTATIALGAAAALLLAVAKDFSEYWVHTRNQTIPAKEKSAKV